MHPAAVQEHHGEERPVDIARVGGHSLYQYGSRHSEFSASRDGYVDNLTRAEKRESRGDETVLGRDLASLEAAHLAEPAHDQQVGDDDQKRDDWKSQPRIQNVERKEHGIGGAALRASG